MNISYNWLKDLIEIDSTPRDLADKLTSVGLEIDEYHELDDDTIFDIEVTSNRGIVFRTWVLRVKFRLLTGAKWNCQIKKIQ